MSIVEDAQGRQYDLFGPTGTTPIGRAEGAAAARDPRATGLEQVVNDPVTGLVKQASWGFNAGLFALPDLAVKGIGKVLGMDEKNVTTLTKLFNRGETGPRNEQERYSRAVFEGIGSGLLPTGVLSFVARGRSLTPVALSPSAGVFKSIANDTLNFIKQNPKQAFFMDAAFGAAHETLKQAVEENMSDDDPERKAFYKDFMPTAALIGLPLAVATLSPTAMAYRFGKQKIGELDDATGSLEKEAIGDLKGIFQKIPGVNIANKLFAKKAKDKLIKTLGASAESPEGKEAMSTLDQIFKDYPSLVAAGFKPNIVERTMDPALQEKAKRALEALPEDSPAKKMLNEQRIKNDAAHAALFDSLTPTANAELQTALAKIQLGRQQLFDSIKNNRADVTEDELTRLAMFYGPLNPDQLNNELRGMLKAQIDLDVGMRKSIMRRMGLSQGVGRDDVPLPVRDEAGQSLFPASNVEQPAIDLLKTYESLLKGRTTMSTEMRSFITKSEPLNTLRKNVTEKIRARDAMEKKLLDDLLDQEVDKQLADSSIMARIKMAIESGASSETVVKEREALKKLKDLAKLLTRSQQEGKPLTRREKAQLEAESGFGTLVVPETGEIRIRLGSKESLTFNPKTIAQDAKQYAAANTAVDMNVPEAIDYLEAAARFRNSALDKHNAVLARSRSSRLTDADQYLALGNKVYNDFEQMILNNVPRMKAEREAMKIVLDDYRSVYETRLPLLIGRKVNEAGATRYSTPNEQVLAAAFRSAEDVRDLSVMLGNDPRGLELLEKGTLNWLQSKKILDKDGLISPKKIKDVLQKNQNIISVLPARVQATLQNEVDTATNVSLRLSQIKEQEDLAADTAFDDFLSKVLQPGTDNVIILEKALSSPIEMSKLVNVLKGDPNVGPVGHHLPALKRAVFNIAKEGTLSGGSLKKFIETNQKSLKVLFDEKHLKDLAALADIGERRQMLAKVTGTAPKFFSTSQEVQQMFGVTIPGAATYARDISSKRVSPEGAAIGLGVRFFSALEESVQNKIMARALVDDKLAAALAKPATEEQKKLILREFQSMGILPRALMANIGVQMAQPELEGRKSSIEGMAALPVRGAQENLVPRENAAAMLRKLPPAPQTRGMPNIRIGPSPAAAPAAAPNLMYPALFPNDPISQMLLQRQQQMASPQ